MNLYPSLPSEFQKDPSKGIDELFRITKNRIITQLEYDLKQDIISSNIFDPIFKIYVQNLISNFALGALVIDIAKCAYNIVKCFEKESNTEINKEKLYGILSLLYSYNKNSLAAAAYLRLAEVQRKKYNPLNNVLKLHKDNLQIQAIYKQLLDELFSNRPVFIKEYDELYSLLIDENQVSLSSVCIKTFEIISFIENYDLSIEIINMNALEVINNLCTLFETELKSNPNIIAAIPDIKDRMLGSMIDKIHDFNRAVSTIINDSTPTGLRKYFNLKNDFNLGYPRLLDALRLGTLSSDSLKAHIIYGIHYLRNNALHQFDFNKAYFNDALTLKKTIGLLLAGISVIKSL